MKNSDVNAVRIYEGRMAMAALYLLLSACAYSPSAASGRAEPASIAPGEHYDAVRFRFTPWNSEVQSGPFVFRLISSSGGPEYAGRTSVSTLTLHDVIMSTESCLVLYSDEHKCDPVILAGQALCDAVRASGGAEIPVPLITHPSKSLLRFIDHHNVGYTGVHAEWNVERTAESDQWGFVVLEDDCYASTLRCDGFAFVSANGVLRDSLNMPDFDLGGCYDVELAPLHK